MKAKVFCHTEGNHEKHKSKSTEFQPALPGKSIQKSQLALHTSQTLLNYEKLLALRVPETLKGLQLVPELSATGFQSKNLAIGTKPMKTDGTGKCNSKRK